MLLILLVNTLQLLRYSIVISPELSSCMSLLPKSLTIFTKLDIVGKVLANPTLPAKGNLSRVLTGLFNGGLNRLQNSFSEILVICLFFC